MDDYNRRDDRDETPAEPSAKLFIGSLAWAATDEDLKTAFEPYGVVEAAVIRYQDTGRSKGFGFVECESVEAATKAMEEMDGKDVAGRPIKVSFARAKREAAE